jgi:hypothetical protein
MRTDERAEQVWAPKAESLRRCGTVRTAKTYPGIITVSNAEGKIVAKALSPKSSSPHERGSFRPTSSLSQGRIRLGGRTRRVERLLDGGYLRGVSAVHSSTR